MNVLIYIALVPLWRHSKNGKNQEDLENGMIRALEPANQNNVLAIAFSTTWKWSIWFFHWFVCDNNTANNEEFY